MSILDQMRSFWFLFCILSGCFCDKPHVFLYGVHAWIKLTFAVISCLLYYGFEIQSVVQGILVTGVAVISRDIIYSTLSGLNEKKGTEQENEKEKDGDDS